MHVEIYDTVSNGSPNEVSKPIVKANICDKNALKKREKREKCKLFNNAIEL